MLCMGCVQGHVKCCVFGVSGRLRTVLCQRVGILCNLWLWFRVSGRLRNVLCVREGWEAYRT